MSQKEFLEANLATQAPFERENINDEDFDQIFEPLNDILDNDPVYTNYETDLYRQVYEFRQLCIEAQLKQAINDREIREKRNTLLNALQNILDYIQDPYEEDIDHEDITTLFESTSIIRLNAKIIGEYMHKPRVQDALEQVAENIERAQFNDCNHEADPSSFDDDFIPLAA